MNGEASLIAALTGETYCATGSERFPAPHEVARLAYRLYEARGRQDGHDVEDWLLAEGLLANGPFDGDLPAGSDHVRAVTGGSS
jgi:hypothetical protein